MAEHGPTRLGEAKLRTYRDDPMAFLADLVVPSSSGPQTFSDIWGDFQVDFFRAAISCLQAVARGQTPPLRGLWTERTKGASKDSDVGCLLLWLLMFTRVPLLIELGADNREQARETLDAMEDVMGLNPWLAKQIEVLATKAKSLRIRAVLEVKTSTDTGTHGSRPNVTVCNELSHISKQRFAETMLDNASKLPHNLTIIATNAGFMQTWQARWRETYRDNPRWHYQRVNYPAPWIPEADIDEARKRNSRSRFDRLWKGIWSSDRGDAIDTADIDAAMRRTGPMDPAEVASGEWVVCGGIDAGVKHDHAAVVLLASKRASPNVRLVYCESWAPGVDGRVDLLAVKSTIEQLDKLYLPAQWNYDPWQMEYMAAELKQGGLPMRDRPSTPDTLGRMANDLLSTFRVQKIELYDAPMLKDDLKKLVIIERRNSGYRLDAPKDAESGHADRAIALAIALPSSLVWQLLDPPDRSRAEDEDAEHIIVT